MRYALLLLAMATGCTAATVSTVRAPTIIHAAPVTVAAPSPEPTSAPTSGPDAVVAALVTVARGLHALPEQVEVTVGGARYACYRWPLEELLRGRINADTLWSVYVREIHIDGRKLDFEVR